MGLQGGIELRMPRMLQFVFNGWQIVGPNEKDYQARKNKHSRLHNRALPLIKCS